jgi:hypothetical protein
MFVSLKDRRHEQGFTKEINPGKHLISVVKKCTLKTAKEDHVGS